MSADIRNLAQRRHPAYDRAFARGKSLFLRVFLLVLSLIVTFLFFLYGFNCYYLLAARRRYRSPVAPALNGSRPAVCIHLPIYNEKYVIARLLNAVACMAAAYGKDRVHIIVLDDSDDDTRDEVDRHIALHAARGMRMEVMRRRDRGGYKAGALQAALERTRDDFIAVFDADFIPSRDFLLRAVPHFLDNPLLGVVQGRWDHINRDYSPLTRALSIGINVHFLIEQPGRYAADCFLNFNGTCGIIRRKALEDAGGWQADTLAEDLDVSYRMQMAGYRIMYVRDLACQGEVPPSMPSFIRQQARWACGSLRTAKKLLARLWKTPGLALRTRLQGFIHLTYYMVHPLMYLSFLLACIGTILGVRLFDLSHFMTAPARDSTLFRTGVRRDQCVAEHPLHPADTRNRRLHGGGLVVSDRVREGQGFESLEKASQHPPPRSDRLRCEPEQHGGSVQSAPLAEDLGVRADPEVRAPQRHRRLAREEIPGEPAAHRAFYGGERNSWNRVDRRRRTRIQLWGRAHPGSLCRGLFFRCNPWLFPEWEGGERRAMIAGARASPVPGWAVLLSITLQVPLAIFLGHLYDTRIFMATGYLVGTGLNPYLPRDLSAVFQSPQWSGLTSIGYPPPWALLLGLAYRASYAVIGNLHLYNLAIKAPVIAANVGLAFAVQRIAARIGAAVTVQRRAMLFMLFNPLLLYTTAAWGQFDSAVALCAVTGMYLLHRQKPLSAAALLALAVSLKPTALPLIPLALLDALMRRDRGLFRLILGLLAALAAFCIAPFAIFGWDPGIILKNWSAHSLMAGGMSWLTFFELLFGTTTIPAPLRILGFLWVPALAIGVIVLRPRMNEGLPELLQRSLGILLVLFLSRAWLSEPNVDLLLPFAVLLCASGRIRLTRLHALWLIPLVFTVFNASAPQLLFLVWPEALTLFSALDEKVRVIRLLARCVTVVPWLVLGWRLILDGRLRAGTRPEAVAIPLRVPGADDPRLSVILPTFNEAENIAEAVNRVESSLACVPGCNAELVVVDDGSPDGTSAKATEASLKYRNVRVVEREGREGLASAIVKGMTAARGDLLAVLDADLQHPPESLPAMVRRITDSSADIVVMSRYFVSGGMDGWGAGRRLASRVATLLTHLLLRPQDR